MMNNIFRVRVKDPYGNVFICCDTVKIWNETEGTEKSLHTQIKCVHMFPPFTVNNQKYLVHVK